MYLGRGRVADEQSHKLFKGQKHGGRMVVAKRKFYWSPMEFRVIYNMV